jgi:hypothetical protein
VQPTFYLRRHACLSSGAAAVAQLQQARTLGATAGSNVVLRRVAIDEPAANARGDAGFTSNAAAAPLNAQFEQNEHVYTSSAPLPSSTRYPYTPFPQCHNVTSRAVQGCHALVQHLALPHALWDRSVRVAGNNIISHFPSQARFAPCSPWPGALWLQQPLLPPPVFPPRSPAVNCRGVSHGQHSEVSPAIFSAGLRG